MIWIISSIILIILLIFFSAFFAAAEMAFVSVDRIKIREEALRKNKNALLLEKLIEKPDEVISALIIGNNIVNIAASILAGAIATYFFGNIGVGIATAIMTLLIIIFGESTPKAIGINNEKFALKITSYIAVYKKVFYPIANLFNIIANYIIRLIGLEKTGTSDIIPEGDEIFINAEICTRNACDWINENYRRKFFLWIHIWEPHQPYIPPEQYLKISRFSQIS